MTGTETLDQPRMEARARALGRLLRARDVVLLAGPMGGGKSTFTRALAAGMGVHRPDRVCSPTYTVCMVHDGPLTLVHVDLFRLGERAGGRVSTAGFESLGLEHDELPGDRSVLVVEWADLWQDPPQEHLALRFGRDPGSNGSSRSLVVLPSGPRGEILAAAWSRSSAEKT